MRRLSRFARKLILSWLRRRKSSVTPKKPLKNFAKKTKLERKLKLHVRQKKRDSRSFKRRKPSWSKRNRRGSPRKKRPKKPSSRLTLPSKRQL